MISSEDPWPHFCQAARSYEQRLTMLELEIEQGELGSAVFKYLRDLKVMHASLCPPPLGRDGHIALRLLHEADAMLAPLLADP